MGSASIVIRQTDCNSSILDRSANRESLSEQDQAGDFCVGFSRVSQVLSDAPRPYSCEEESQGSQENVDLEQLWFRLSNEERARFGGCFSRMVLRILEGHSDHAGGHEL